MNCCMVTIVGPNKSKYFTRIGVKATQSNTKCRSSPTECEAQYEQRRRRLGTPDRLPRTIGKEWQPILNRKKTLIHRELIGLQHCKGLAAVRGAPEAGRKGSIGTATGTAVLAPPPPPPRHGGPRARAYAGLRVCRPPRRRPAAGPPPGPPPAPPRLPRPAPSPPLPALTTGGMLPARGRRVPPPGLPWARVRLHGPRCVLSGRSAAHQLRQPAASRARRQ